MTVQTQMYIHSCKQEISSDIKTRVPQRLSCNRIFLTRFTDVLSPLSGHRRGSAGPVHVRGSWRLSRLWPHHQSQRRRLDPRRLLPHPPGQPPASPEPAGTARPVYQRQKLKDYLAVCEIRSERERVLGFNSGTKSVNVVLILALTEAVWFNSYDSGVQTV